MVGRWLTANHPEIVAPELWDEALAFEYVSYICTTTSGQYVSAHGLKCLISKGQVGKPFAPTTIDHRLAVMRHFFRVLQDRPHLIGDLASCTITRRFNPVLAFATPPPIKRLIQPDPRDIDEVIWCKLTYAAATLTTEDYAVTWNYPSCITKLSRYSGSPLHGALMRLHVSNWGAFGVIETLKCSMSVACLFPARLKHNFVICMFQPTKREALSGCPFRGTPSMQ